MTPVQIKTLLSALKIKLGKPRAGWVTAHCPFAEWRHDKGKDTKPSFGVRIEPKDRPFSFCMSCQWHGDVEDMMLELRGRSPDTPRDWKTAMQVLAAADADPNLSHEWGPDVDDIEAQGPKHLHVFPESWLEHFPRAEHYPVAAHYLGVRRRMPLAVCRALDMRYDSYEDRVCFPVRDWGRNLVGLHGRAIADDADLKYRMYTYKALNNPIAWLGEAWLDVEKPVIVAESVFDLARVFQVYRNVCCPLSASFSLEKARRLGDLYEIWTMFDEGKAGDRAHEQMQKAYPNQTIGRFFMPPGSKDPGEMTWRAVAQLIAPYLPLDPVLA